MNRRSGPWIVRILLAVAFTASAFAPHAVAAAPRTSAHVDAVVLVAGAGTAPPSNDDIVVDTTNPFLPADRDLTECVGSVERPGCGSQSRGGWHQNLVAIAMVSGLFLVFGRVVWAVRRSQKNASSTPD